LIIIIIIMIFSNVESYLQYRSVSTSVCLQRSKQQCSGWWTARHCRNV